MQNVKKIIVSLLLVFFLTPMLASAFHSNSPCGKMTMYLKSKIHVIIVRLTNVEIKILTDNDGNRKCETNQETLDRVSQKHPHFTIKGYIIIKDEVY